MQYALNVRKDVLAIFCFSRGADLVVGATFTHLSEVAVLNQLNKLKDG